MSGKKFKVSIFGYSKKSVSNYIIEIDRSVKARLLEKNEEIEKLKRYIEELEEESRVTNEQKNSINCAIIEAMENAERIKAQAEQEAEQIIEESEKEAQERASEIERRAKEEIRCIKEDILKEQEKAEKEFKAAKAEIIKEYENEFRRVKKIKSELQLLKTAAAIIVNNSDSEIFASKKTIHKILNGTHRISNDASIEEIEQLL